MRIMWTQIVLLCIHSQILSFSTLGDLQKFTLPFGYVSRIVIDSDHTGFIGFGIYC